MRTYSRSHLTLVVLASLLAACGSKAGASSDHRETSPNTASDSGTNSLSSPGSDGGLESDSGAGEVDAGGGGDAYADSGSGTGADAGSDGGGPKHPSTNPAGDMSGQNLGNFFGGSPEPDWASFGPQFSVILLQPWNYAWIADIHKVNPKTMVLEYKDLSSSRNDVCVNSNSASLMSQLPAGIDECWAKNNHPEWFLVADTTHPTLSGTDGINTTKCGPAGANGGSGDMLYLGYNNACEMDYGSAAYQEQWTTNVLADIQLNGWDGVFADNAFDRGVYGYSTKYDTDADTQTAMISMVKAVCPPITSAGKVCIPNMGNGGDAMTYPSFWGALLPYTSGGLQEFFLSWSDGTDVKGAADWQVYANEVSSCVSQGKACVFRTGSYDDNVGAATRTYAEATILLYTDGNQTFGWGNDDNTTVVTTSMGAASGSASETSTNPVTWSRTFASGSASVEPVAGTGTIN
ncbi:MAG: putative glycoside hydrolase [Polyangiaceae bacterium]